MEGLGDMNLHLVRRCGGGARRMRVARDKGIGANRRDGNSRVSIIRLETGVGERRWDVFGFGNDRRTCDGNWPRHRLRRRGTNRGRSTVPQRTETLRRGDGRSSEFKRSELAEITKYVDHHANLKWEVKSAEQGRVE